MSDDFVFSQFYALPENLKKEVFDFIQFLKLKSNAANNENSGTRILGSARGEIIMHDDFDEPLEELKD